jgi:putative ABC transport system permease protein
MDTLLKDFRYGVRTLLRNPTFTVVAVITLALGIGANTAIFSVVNTVLLRALPFQNPERLVSITKSAAGEGLPGIAAYQYLEWHDKNSDFADIAGYSSDNYNLTGQGQDPERVSCGQVTASFFSTLGVPALRGRALLPDEDNPGGNRAVVISEAFWQRRFGSSESVLGSSLILDDKSYVVVGIMPRSFRFPSDYDMWVPLALDRVRETQGHMFTLVEVVGRLKSDASVEHAQAELNLLARQAAEQAKEELPVSGFELVPLHKFLVTGVRRTVLILWGAVGLVLLLACANVASLMLSRTAARQREMAVRAAVGARRWQLIRQLLVESVVLSVVGGVLGILIAVWCTGAIAYMVPHGFTSSIHDLSTVSMDWRVFGFTLFLSVLTGVIFGLVPALTASKPNLVRAFREGSFSNLIGFGLRSVRGWLVVAELALAMVLLLAAGLLVRSFQQLHAVDLGFARENVLTLRFDLPRSGYSSPSQVINFQNQLVARVKALPGVQTVGTITHTPLSGFGIIAFTGIEGYGPPDHKKDKPIGVGSVSPDYFRTLKIPLLNGRVYDDRDVADSAKVAIVNQAFARKYFGGDNALGKRVGFGCKDDLCRTIVGVVGNVRQESLTDEVVPEMYLPAAQMPMNSMTLFVRTEIDPLNLVGSVRNEVLALDRNQPIYDVKTMEQRVAESVSVTRSLMFLFSAFALLALVLASVGTYGIVSYSASQRTHEIGIRMALGARRGHVLRLILRNGVILATTGIAVGLASAFALTRFLTTLLFGITPTDTVTFVVVALGLFLVAVAACLIPARRATKVDPLVALRYE